MLSRFAVILCAVACVAGCAARSNVATPGPDTVNVDAYSRVAVNVVSSVPDNVTAEAARLERDIVDELRKTGRFGDVGTLAAAGTASPPGTLRLTATITGIRKIGAGKRFLAGAFAGRARVTLKVQLVEAGGSVVGEQVVTGESGGTGLSGGTNDALSQAAKAIAKWLGPRA